MSKETIEDEFIEIEGEMYPADEVGRCERCEVQEHIDNLMDTDMGYICECCEGDLT